MLLLPIKGSGGGGGRNPLKFKKFGGNGGKGNIGKLKFDVLGGLSTPKRDGFFSKDSPTWGDSGLYGSTGEGVFLSMDSTVGFSSSSLMTRENSPLLLVE